MTTIAVHDATAVDAACKDLTGHGAVVIRGVLGDREIDAVVSELDGHVSGAEAATTVSADAFYPGYTRRVTAIIRKSPASHALAMHPVVLDLCDRTLLPNCERYQLHVGSALVVGPGARSQVLHREDDSYPFFEVPRPDCIVATMWAFSDFTAANGATLMVPGSHRWAAGRRAAQHEILSAEMRRGDVLVWMGGTLHGAGANTTADEWRYGLFFSYSLGWLRQEENQYVDAPLPATRMSKEMRDLLGYRMHGGLGFYDPASLGH